VALTSPQNIATFAASRFCGMGRGGTPEGAGGEMRAGRGRLRKVGEVAPGSRCTAAAYAWARSSHRYVFLSVR
jgi:hypothetical protein